MEDRLILHFLFSFVFQLFINKFFFDENFNGLPWEYMQKSACRGNFEV